MFDLALLIDNCLKKVLKRKLTLFYQEKEYEKSENNFTGFEFVICFDKKWFYPQGIFTLQNAGEK